VRDAGPGTWRVGHAHIYVYGGGRRSYRSNGEGGAFGLNRQLPNLAVIKLRWIVISPCLERGDRDLL
jgi:hypothetical protein